MKPRDNCVVSGDNAMFRNFVIMTAVILAFMGAMASAEVIDIHSGQFTVLSGRDIGTDPTPSFQGSLTPLVSDIDLDAGLTSEKDEDITHRMDLSAIEPVTADYRFLSAGLNIIMTPAAGAIDVVIAINIVEKLDMIQDAVVVQLSAGYLDIGGDTNITAQFRAYDDLSSDSYGTISSIVGFLDR
jgi:hypothetical protein